MVVLIFNFGGDELSNINVKCIDQSLTFTNSPVIASGGILEDSVVFDFSDEWTGYSRKAVFWKSKDDTYYIDLDENDTCIIPKEVLAKKGTMYFGVFGTCGNVTRTSEVLKYKVVEGVMVSDDSDASEVPDPTPSVYERLLSSYQEVHNACNDLDNDKADKVAGAIAGNVAVLDATGNLVDGGKKIDEITMNIPNLQATTSVSDSDLVAVHVVGANQTGGLLKKITVSRFASSIATAIGNFFAKTVTYQAATTTDGWSTSAPYTQTVEVVGMLDTDNPIPGVVYGTSASENAAIKAAWGCVDRITTAADSVTFICFDTLPETDFTANLKVVR